MSFGEKLTNLRRAHNYTQEQFANLLGVSRQAVSRWESGTAYPETEKLIKIGEMFDCSIDYLLKDSMEDPPNSSSHMENPEPKPKSKKKRKVIAAVTAVSVIVIAVLAVALIPRRATITISVPTEMLDDKDYKLTYKEIASTVNYPFRGEKYLYKHGSWDLDGTVRSNSSFGVIDVKNIGKGTVGSSVFVDARFEMLYLFDNNSGMWRVFKLDSYTDNAPPHIKLFVDQGNGEYYKYYVS